MPLPCEQQSESRRREIRWWSSPWVPRPEAKPSAHQLPVTVRFSPADRTANHHHRTFQVFHNHQPGFEIHQSPMLGCVSSETDLKTVRFLSIIIAFIGIEKTVLLSSPGVFRSYTLFCEMKNVRQATLFQSSTIWEKLVGNVCEVGLVQVGVYTRRMLGLASRPTLGQVVWQGGPQTPLHLLTHIPRGWQELLRYKEIFICG